MSSAATSPRVRTAARLVRLDDDDAHDPRRVGAKAARLARARAAALPVLPGVVVPVEEGRHAVDAGVQALAAGGSGAARLAVMQIQPDPAVVHEAMGAGFTTAIVRSSSELETGGVWSGAFSTFEEVTPDQLATAVRGVWASVFTVQALERFGAAGVDPRDAGMAVLIQPQVKPSCGGVATLRDDGTVYVVATGDRLAGLVAGWDTGVRATVTPGGTVDGGDKLNPFGPEPFAAAADLARSVHELLGDDGIEWAVVDDEVVLLQSTRSVPTKRRPRVERRRPGLGDPLALRIAVAAATFPGSLAEDLVLPWWPAADGELVRSTARPTVRPLEDLAEAVTVAASLTERAWADLGGAASAQTFLRRLRSDGATGELAGLRPVPASEAQRVVDLLDGVAAAVVRHGLVPSTDTVWRHRPHEIRAWLARAEAPLAPTLGPDPWEPFVFSVLMTMSPLTTGIPAAPGTGAGWVMVVADPHAPPVLPARSVVAAALPLPALAPLLWGAAGLICLAGNPGAHLVEVARSLGVPAVVGLGKGHRELTICDLDGGRVIAAVDGDEGVVALHS